MEALLYDCVAWIHLKVHLYELRIVHHRMLLRILGVWYRSRYNRTLLYSDALKRTGCEDIKITTMV